MCVRAGASVFLCRLLPRRLLLLPLRAHAFSLFLPFSAAQLNSPAPSQRRRRTAELRELEMKVAKAKNVTPQQVRGWKESVSKLKNKLAVEMLHKAKSGRSREFLKSVLRNYRTKGSTASL